MKNFPDLLYYDYVLYKIVSMYIANEDQDAILPYLKLATVLHKLIKDEKISIDSEIYVKEILIKALQFSVKLKKSYSDIDSLMQGLLTILKDCQIKYTADPKICKIKNIIYLCCMHIYSDRPDFCPYFKIVLTDLGYFDFRRLFQEMGFRGEFEYSLIHKELVSIKFMKPAMCSFTDNLIEKIESNLQPKPKIHGSSPGEKIAW